MSAFAALHVTAFRRVFLSQSFSLVGNWLSLTAAAWLAYDLTGDAFSLGVVVFAQQLPVLLLAPVAGVLGDRTDRRNLFTALQAACALHATLLATLSFTGHLLFPVLVSLSVLRGIINAAEWPTRQAIALDLVGDRSLLANAIALNSSLFNVARMIGPAVAGLLIARFHVGWCYALDAASCLPTIGVMLFGLAPRPGTPPPPGPPTHPLRALHEGFRYAAREPGLRNPLLLIALTAFSGFAAGTLAPLIARDLLHGDARLLGLLNAAVGLGALTSALALGSLRPAPDRLERWVGGGALLLAVGQTLCALSPARLPTLAGMVVCGAGIVLTYAGANTLLQLRVDDARRSRVMGLFTTAQSIYPVGSLLIGAMAASALGPRATIAAHALVCVFAGWFFLRTIRHRTPIASGGAETAVPAT
ncbi:MAG: MFS transporter [Verrucomicrobia bacterium]|nr:MFS transporter [Verrucomicrobiota bacterium]